eukprot:g2272.t1
MDDTGGTFWQSGFPEPPAPPATAEGTRGTDECAPDDADATVAKLQARADKMVERGELDGARQLYERVIARNAAEVVGETVETSSVKRDLVGVLQQLGELEQARHMMQEVHAFAATKPEGDDPMPGLEMKEQLAILHFQLREFEEARKLLEDVVAGMKRLGDCDEAELAATMEILAKTHVGLDNPRKACAVRHDIVMAYTAQFGANDDQTLDAKLALAIALQDLGELEQARRAYEEVIAGGEEVACHAAQHGGDAVGKEGGGVVTMLHAKSGLANLLRDLCDEGKALFNGQAEDARRLYTEGLEGYSARLGPSHEHALAVHVGRSGLVANHLSDSAEARRLLTESVEALTAHCGATHEDTLVAKMLLANTVAGQGGRAEARKLWREIVEGNTTLHGPEHPDTLLAKGGLALQLQSSAQPEDWEEARLIFAGLVHEYSSHIHDGEYGDGEEDEVRDLMLGAKLGVAKTLGRQAEYEEARRVLHEVMAAGTAAADLAKVLDAQVLQVLGERGDALRACIEVVAGHAPGEADIADQAHGLAVSTVVEQLVDEPGEREGTVRVCAEIIAAHEERLGGNDQGVVIAKVNLGNLLRQLGQPEEARRLYAGAIEACTAALGACHPNTLSITLNLADLLENQGDLNAARELFEQCVTGYEALHVRFEYSAEAQAINHNYKPVSGLEDLSYFSVASLAATALFCGALSWGYGRSKPLLYLHALTAFLVAIVAVQYYHIFFAAVRFSRVSDDLHMLGSCLTSNKGGKHVQTAAMKFPNTNPCCMGRMGLDLRCMPEEKDAGLVPGVCRECATWDDVSSAQVAVSESWCDADYGHPLSPKYCARGGPPRNAGEAPCAQLAQGGKADWVCHGCPMFTQGDRWMTCETRQAGNASASWVTTSLFIDKTKDCRRMQGAVCTKAEPCTPCGVPDLHRLGYVTGAPGLTRDWQELQGGRCETCKSRYDGHCDFVEGIGPYCRKDASGNDIEPCKRCCSEQPEYPFTSTGGKCV